MALIWDVPQSLDRLLPSYQEEPLYSPLSEPVYAVAPCLLKDAEHQADADPPLYLVPWMQP